MQRRHAQKRGWSVWKLLFAAVLCCWDVFVAGAAPVPEGPEFQVNTRALGPQHSPSLAADPSGAFVVVWQGGDQNSWIVGQWLDNAGQRLGTEFFPTHTSPGSDSHPFLAGNRYGRIALVWERRASINQGSVFAAHLYNAGYPPPGELQIDTGMSGVHRLPTVAVDASGEVEFAWYFSTTSSSALSTLRRRFASSGLPLDLEMDPFPTPPSASRGPSLAMDAAGQTVAVWWNGESVMARRFDAAGRSVGGDFQVSSNPLAYDPAPAVAMDDTGGFVVVWANSLPVENIVGRRFDSLALPEGGEIEISVGPHLPGEAKVSMNGTGDFVVVWESYQDGSGSGVFG